MPLTSHRTLARVALSLAVLLAACDSPSSSGHPTPSVSFRYAGTVSGRYAITAPRPAVQPATQSFVEGVTPGGNAFQVSSFAFADSVHDVVIIEGPTAPGTYTIGGAACDPLPPLCPNVYGGFQQLDGNTPRNGERGFYITQGTLTIEPPLAPGRIRGRFSGTAALSRYEYGWQGDGTLAITDGSFETDLAPSAASF